MAPARSSIALGGARNLVFRTLTACSDAGVVVVTARALGADGRGKYAIASLAASTLVVLLGGTGTALAAQVAHRRAEAGQLHAAAVVAGLGGGALCGVVIAAVGVALGGTASVLVYAALAGPFATLSTLQMALFMARGEVMRLSITGLSISLASLLALSAVAILAPGDVDLALSAWVAAQAAVALTVFAIVARDSSLRFGGVRHIVSRLVRQGAPVSLANGIALLNYRVDVIVVAALLPVAEVGRYSVAVAIGESLLILSRALGTGSYAPIISRDNVDALALLVRSIRHAVLLLVAGGTVVLVLMHWLMVPIFGPSFDVWEPLALLLPGIVALGAIVEFVRLYFLVRLERSREYLAAVAVAMLANLILALVLVPPLGLTGAALSTSISYLSSATFLLVRLRRFGGPAGPRAYVPRRSDLADYRALLTSLRRG